MKRVIDGARVPMSQEEQDIFRAEQPKSSPMGPANFPLPGWKLNAMLEVSGKTQAVQDAIDAIPDATDRAVARARLSQGGSFRRDDPIFTLLGGAADLTDAEWMTAKDLA